MALDSGSRFGWAGLVLTLVGIAIAIIWPDKKWLGWLCLFAAGALTLYWLSAEFAQRYSKSAGLWISIAVGAIIGGALAGFFWNAQLRVRHSAPFDLPNPKNKMEHANATEHVKETQSTNQSVARDATRTDAMHRTVDPISALTDLGWSIENQKDGLRFTISTKPLPDMQKSEEYFKLLNRPFSIDLQQVPNLDGFHHLSTVKELTKVEISASAPTNLSELADFRNLRILIVSQTPFNSTEMLNIDGLADLENLRALSLNMSRVENLAPLQKLTKLTSLNIGGTLVRDLSPISGFKSLETLDVRDSNVTDLSSIQGDLSLRELSIDSKQVSSLDDLSALPNLKKLMLISQTPTNLEAIGKLANLNSLMIWGLPVIDISPLSNLQKLTDLQISSNRLFGQPVAPVEHIEALRNLPQLKSLSLGGLQITSLSFLSGYRALVSLNLNYIPITSIQEVASLNTLKEVSLVGVPVVDISPLLSLPNLQKLYLLRTPARADVIAMLQQKGVTVTNP